MTVALAIGGAGLVLLILVVALRKLPGFQAGIPGWAGGIISGLLLGLGLGFVLMSQLGYHWERQGRPSGAAVDPAKSGQQAGPVSSGPTVAPAGGGSAGPGGP